MSDQIEILGIEGFGYHGVFPQERRDGQNFLVDIVLKLKSSKARKSDQLSDAIDYSRVISLVHETIVGEPFNLIERLAEVIAEKILATYDVKSVEVVVHKPDAPIGLKVSDIALRIKRKP
jgi:dihydroneopterin aldolase